MMHLKYVCISIRKICLAFKVNTYLSQNEAALTEAYKDGALGE